MYKYFYALKGATDRITSFSFSFIFFEKVDPNETITIRQNALLQKFVLLPLLTAMIRVSVQCLH